MENYILINEKSVYNFLLCKPMKYKYNIKLNTFILVLNIGYIKKTCFSTVKILKKKKYSEFVL